MMKNNKLGSLFWILLVVCILNIVGHLAVYPALPDTVPIHWGASGEVNGWSSKQSNPDLLRAAAGDVGFYGGRAPHRSQAPEF